MDLEAGAELTNLEGIANAVEIQPQAGVDTDRLKRELFVRKGVTSVQPVSAVAETIRDAINETLDFLNIVRAAVLLLALLIGFNSSSIGADERAREYATMFAFGLPTRTVLLLSVIESFVIGVLATVAGIAFGLALLSWLVRVLLPTTLPDLGITIDVAGSTYLTAAVLGILAVSLAPLLTYRKLRRMDIPSTLRVVE
jgi:putative ABC transport system permease protein